MVQYQTLHCYPLVASEGLQHSHHEGRTSNHEDDEHEDPYYDMIDILYNPVGNDIVIKIKQYD